MDLFEHRYYRLNKFLLKLFGQWPYQSTNMRSVLLVVILLTAASQMIPQAIAVAKHLDDWDYIVECTTPFTFDAFCLIKIFTSVINSQKMFKLLERLRTNWEIWDQDDGIDIFHEYAQKGRKLTVLYTDCWTNFLLIIAIGMMHERVRDVSSKVFGIHESSCCVEIMNDISQVQQYYTTLLMLYAALTTMTCVLFMTQPIVPKIIDILMMNGTAPGEFPTPVDYHYIDAQKYYFYILLHLYVVSSMAFFIVAACDTMFIVYVQHGCGLFAALGHKLQRLGENNRSMEEMTGVFERPNKNLKHLIASCIDRHNDAIEYAKLIEETYSWCFFIIVGMNMFLISITGFQVLKKFVDPQTTLRFVVSNVVAMVHLYIENDMAQNLMDHSTAIRDCILNGEWYTLPLKTQKLLLITMMRCNVPCKLTAGKVTTLSVETFRTVLKTSLSYFTLLRSL